jgi:DNA-binding response OmpR family regulator
MASGGALAGVVQRRGRSKKMTDERRALVVDDEANIRFFIREALGRTGYAVEETASGEQALDLLRDTRYDLLILDLRLGGRVDGMRVLNAVRWRWPATAVVILTGHGSLDSAMAAIREGVDGYLLKPVDASELREVVGEALERRQALCSTDSENADEPDVLRYGPLTVDLSRHEVEVNEHEVELTPQELKLLVHLIRNSDRVIEPPELVYQVRGYKTDTIHEARQVIKWYVHRLRQKIEPDPSNPRYVLNVRGVGYCLAEF